MNELKILSVPLEDIIAGCLRGERLSQKQLYEKYYGKMMMVCMRFARDEEESIGLINEGFLKVFEKLHSFRPESSLESWIRRIMINNAIDNYRRNKKYQHLADIECASYLSSSEEILPNLTADEIIFLIQKLPPSYRTVFNLFVLEGLSHKEIGQQLNISEGSSKSNLSKARTKLQFLIKKLYLK